ncbi:MAG: histidinol dehydrogenase [Candidatus Korobacteraceae bacterium]|jgi:histidinol dehydrogenase
MRVLDGSEAASYVTEKLVSRGSTIQPKVERTVAQIVRDVRAKGDEALRRYAQELDGLGEEESVLVSREELEAARSQVSPEFTQAIERAARNIRKFAEWQMPRSWVRTMEPGIRVGQRVEPVASVGCYVPGGRYPLPSSVLMTVIPAQVAGVRRIQVASPRPAPETLAAAAMLGVESFYRIGGAQAVAAFAYGTDSVPRVAKIVGPGNSYVTAAKKMVAFDCSIDMLAGPTEAIVFADRGNAEFFASDLVAQAEHDPETLPIFVTTNLRLAQEVAKAAMAMAAENPIACKSLSENGVALVARAADEAFVWINAIAAEHLTVDAANVHRVFDAGSVFVGEYSPQSLGDYASGPNHVLPTGGVARYRGGLSVMDYVKIISVQQVSKSGLKRIGPAVALLAEAEGLRAHAESVRVRMK